MIFKLLFSYWTRSQFLFYYLGHQARSNGIERQILYTKTFNDRGHGLRSTWWNGCYSKWRNSTCTITTSFFSSSYLSWWTALSNIYINICIHHFLFQAISEKGYVKRMQPSTFNLQNRGTMGKSVGKLRVNDALSDFIVCRTHDRVLYFRYLRHASLMHVSIMRLENTCIFWN